MSIMKNYGSVTYVLLFYGTIWVNIQLKNFKLLMTNYVLVVILNGCMCFLRNQLLCLKRWQNLKIRLKKFLVISIVYLKMGILLN